MEPVSKPQSAIEFIVQALRQGIEEGFYAPGQRLVEPELREALKVSRSSLREAFSRLCAEGIIDIVPNKGAIVRRFSTRDIRNIQQVRKVLEPLAASLAAAAIDEPGNRAYFETVAATWLRDPPVQDGDEYARENRVFHQAIAEISGNDQLAIIGDRLKMSLFAAHFRQRTTFEMRSYAAAQHREIIAAVLAGDSQAAESAMRAHIGHSDATVLPDDNPNSTSNPADRQRLARRR